MNININERISKIFGEEVSPKFNGDEKFAVEINYDENIHIFPEISVIFIPEKLRNKGLGKKLLSATLQALKEAGHDYVGLYAFPYSHGEGNTIEDIIRLIHWYEKQGFILDDSYFIENTLEENLSRVAENYPDGKLPFEEVKHFLWMERTI